MQPVKCPTCDKPSRLDAANPFRPFCSERCKLIDLGEWFEETRGIASEQDADWPQQTTAPPRTYQ